MSARIESICVGSAWKFANASPMTLDTKSGLVSRSRNCETNFAEPTNSADLVWILLNFEVSALLLAGTALGLIAIAASIDFAVPSPAKSAFAPSGFFGLAAIIQPSIGASIAVAPMAVSNSG